MGEKDWLKAIMEAEGSEQTFKDKVDWPLYVIKREVTPDQYDSFVEQVTQDLPQCQISYMRTLSPHNFDELYIVNVRIYDKDEAFYAKLKYPK